MPNLKLQHLQYISGNIDARLSETLQHLQDAVNHMAAQLNANPVGATVAAPPDISSVSVEVLAPGIHKVSVQDNNPVHRGVWYVYEASTTSDFQVGTVIVSGITPSRDHIANMGAGALYWRAYSQYPTSGPSSPVAAPAAVDAGGGTRSGSFTGSGSGTEPSIQPQPGAGFGFTNSRLDQT